MSTFRNFVLPIIIWCIMSCNLALLQELDCSIHPNISSIHTFTIPSDSRLGPLNMLFVQHNTVRKIPFATTSILNYLNLEANVSRNDNFRRHPCNRDKQLQCKNSFRMTPEQEKISNGRTSWDRGHLSPSNAFRYSADANNGTFFCVNIAPQDPYTNQQPWNTLEQKILNYFEDGAGYVITGVCDRDNLQSPTLLGFPVPDCHWKLICYNDLVGVTQVVGWIGNNTIVATGDVGAQNVRRADTLTPRSQQDIIDVLAVNNFQLLMEAWQGAEAYLLKNRNEFRVPTAESCMAVRILPPNVKHEWNVLFEKDIIEEQALYPEIDSELF